VQGGEIRLEALEKRFGETVAVTPEDDAEAVAAGAGSAPVSAD
jgi:hypothetical protein